MNEQLQQRGPDETGETAADILTGGLRAMTADMIRRHILSHRQISPKELKARGWTPLGARCYRHRDGWEIQHCGHPTALWPYLLYDQNGKRILTGAAVSGRADYGTAWPTVASAVDYVAAVVPGGFEL